MGGAVVSTQHMLNMRDEYEKYKADGVSEDEMFRRLLSKYTVSLNAPNTNPTTQNGSGTGETDATTREVRNQQQPRCPFASQASERRESKEPDRSPPPDTTVFAPRTPRESNRLKDNNDGATTGTDRAVETERVTDVLEGSDVSDTDKPVTTGTQQEGTDGNKNRAEGTTDQSRIDPNMITKVNQRLGFMPVGVMLLKSIGGYEKVLELCDKFYNKAFEDKVLDPFFRTHDAAHGSRLARWVVDEMQGRSSGFLHTIDRAHKEAMDSKKRQPEVRGKDFTVVDCRIWMRLMFWTCREEGLGEGGHNAAFFKWFVMFIGQMIGKYNIDAPPWAQESAQWSASAANLTAYEGGGRLMRDVVGEQAHIYLRAPPAGAEEELPWWFQDAMASAKQ